MAVTMWRSFFCLLALGFLAAHAAAEPPQDVDAPALRIYIDPATGQPTDPPAIPPARAAQPNENVSTSHEGLTIRKGTTRAGGEILDLNGRFQDELRIDLDATGHKASCNPPGSAGSKP